MSIEELCHDVWGSIASHIDPLSASRLSSASNFFKQRFSGTGSFWENLLNRDFGVNTWHADELNYFFSDISQDDHREKYRKLCFILGKQIIPLGNGKTYPDIEVIMQSSLVPSTQNTCNRFMLLSRTTLFYSKLMPYDWLALAGYHASSYPLCGIWYGRRITNTQVSNNIWFRPDDFAITFEDLQGNTHVMGDNVTSLLGFANILLKIISLPQQHHFGLVKCIVGSSVGVVRFYGESQDHYY